MKKMLIAVMLVALAFTLAYAADSVTYESTKGNVTFNHKGHSDAMACTACHAGEPAKIVVDKDAAHGATCKDCHKEKGVPTKCNDCHAK